MADSSCFSSAASSTTEGLFGCLLSFPALHLAIQAPTDQATGVQTLVVGSQDMQRLAAQNRCLVARTM